MKRTILTVLVAIVLLVGGYGVVWAMDAPAPPHTDYRAGYGSSCSGNAACHTISKGSFLPASIDTTASTDFTEFCLACHNASGEAHDKSAGTPSTNTYPVLTGGETGTSHSWNGVVGNAGTRVPTLPGFGGTAHMPNGNVITCQVCHQGMGKSMTTASYVEDNLDWRMTTTSDNVNYVIDNGSGTPLTSTRQYLAQYIRVFRTTGLMTRPTNSRTKKTYLVKPSEYTYDYSTATVTFAAAQSPTDYIYVDIPEPYFREGNNANAICLDCHNDRADSGVSHAPGTGVNDNHPSVVTYTHSSGLHDTLKATADTNIYIESGEVLCTSCHDPHNAASNNGQLTRNADASALCTNCHKVNGYDGYSTAFLANHNGSKHSSATVCLDCHTTHNTTNIMLIRNTINGKTINFSNFTGANSFGNDTGSSLCEACHTATNYHKSDGTGTGHNTGKDCTACHSHAAGFDPGMRCDSCHGFPPAPAPTNWADTTGDAHASHMTHLNTAQFGFLTSTDACKQCHGDPNVPRTDHNTGKTTAGITQTTWTSWSTVGGSWGATSFSDGGTTGMTDTSDDTCTNVACHSAAGTRMWGGTDCDSCHSFPGSATNDWPAGNGHASRYDGVTNTHMPATGYDPKTDTYVALTSDTTRCGKCHYSGNLATHMNGVVNINPQGHADCTGTNFTVNVITTGSDVTCSNVDCHRKTTPNWY